MTVATTVNPTDQRPWYWWVPYIYLLRVQLLTAMVLFIGPPLALLSPLLRGLFDLDYGPWWRTAFGVALVTLAAFASAWTLMATTWTTALNAPARFGTARIERIRYPITWPDREAFAILALPTVFTVVGYSWYASRVKPWILLFGVAAGLGVAVGALLVARSSADRLHRTIHRSSRRGWILNFLRFAVRRLDRPDIREGYIDPRTRELTPGHTLVWVVFSFSLVLYLSIGLGKWLRIGYETNVSTLACVLLLLMMLCWMLVSLTFFLDRYRVSGVAALAVLAFGIGLLPLPGSENVYRTWPAAHDPSPRPERVLTIGSRTPILVAATGGGIQAAAWTARVLTGIDNALPPDLRDSFTHSIRLLSTVSGGGVGAMYFSERYKDNGFDRHQLDKVVAQAEASSLDDVAWGATYPDAWATLIPPVRLLLGDRGQALERAWTRSLEVARPLSAWRTQVWSDLRPANIFNATLVDSGERLLIGTSRLGWTEEDQRGLRNFEEYAHDRDLQVVTAARLAASFTYVSPATRPEEKGRAAHVVDGGYYDDYGMSTLMEWLNEGLIGTGWATSFPRVLVLQIRSDPGDKKTTPDRWHGPFYQLLAPVETLLNVRTTGQISHNNEELELLQQLGQTHGVEIDNVVFRFCSEHPPLSWHLTGLEKAAIEHEWDAHVANRLEIGAIEAFLRGAPLPKVLPGKPYDVPLNRCTTASTSDASARSDSNSGAVR